MAIHADLAQWEGKQRWIEARAAVLMLIRRMSKGDALAKAKTEFAYFAALDRRNERPKERKQP